MSYWLNSEYAKWIVDPDDPEVKAQRKRKVKPPPFPLIAPVAHRPPSVATEYEQAYVELVETVRPTTAGPPQKSSGPVVEWVTSAEFDRVLEML